MDIFSLIFGLIDFLKFLIPLSIISFVLSKLGFIAKEKLEEKYELTWIKSVLTINLASIFVILFFTYIYFILLGSVIFVPSEPELEYNLIEKGLMIALATIRIVIATIILSLALLFFEILASFIISYQKEQEYSKTIKEFVGVLVSCAVFLFLLFFFFNWVPLGLFVYIFYGFIGELPLLLPLLITLM